ncbi:hypothetical protein DFH27DRAFT_570786 [Peziza echinospora]|nr:hypothetical protein DFH27DRAFT_570786 [Peziza echinospora]
MTVWLRIFEVWLTAKLLGSPSFRRGVSHIHQRIHYMRTGERPYPPPHERGGTYMEGEESESLTQNLKKFGQFFMEEFRNSTSGKKQ